MREQYINSSLCAPIKLKWSHSTEADVESKVILHLKGIGQLWSHSDLSFHTLMEGLLSQIWWFPFFGLGTTTAFFQSCTHHFSLCCISTSSFPRGMHHHSLPAQPECQSCLQPCHRFLKSTDQLLFTRVCVKFENGDKRQTYSPLLLTKLTLCALLTHYRKIAFARWRSCFLAIVYT